MRRTLPGSARGRAVIAVIALYALLLQAFLGTLVPAAVAAPGLQEICAQAVPGPSHDDQAGCSDHACCLPVHVEQLRPSLVPHVVEAPAWPVRASLRIVWRQADAVLPRAPPDPSASPRGPPTA